MAREMEQYIQNMKRFDTLKVKVEAMQSCVSQMGEFFYMCFPSVNNICSEVTRVEEITLPALVSYGL